MQSATADAVIDAINEYIDAKMDSEKTEHLYDFSNEGSRKHAAVAQLDRAHDRLRHVLMTGIA